ncbi:hypothetical protein DYQ86_06485 [Acidobacteria bacterium AB60]|nr:hypothetical protein DYQ86_06485 [Acidobacteria bacterium AB60]
MATNIGRARSLSIPISDFRLVVGAKVEILGERGIFLVAFIDRRRHVVNLQPLQDGPPQNGIHISAIRVLPETQSVRTRTIVSELLEAGD